MTKFETLPTLELCANSTALRSQTLPELVHLEDPAVAVLTDFRKSIPHTIRPDETMIAAYNEMQTRSVHQLVVVNSQGFIDGVIGSEDILGEKPIQESQTKRIPREEIRVKDIMNPITDIAALNMDDVETARVGNIVQTLTSLRKHYAFVIQVKNGKQIARGVFNTFQIGKQLHQDIASSIDKAQSVSELKKRDV